MIDDFTRLDEAQFFSGQAFNVGRVVLDQMGFLAQAFFFCFQFAEPLVEILDLPMVAERGSEPSVSQQNQYHQADQKIGPSFGEAFRE